MGKQFNRRWALIFGPRGGEGKKTQALRVVFRVEKLSGSEPNTGSFDVYNLAPESRSLLERSDVVQFACGYFGDSETALVADVEAALLGESQTAKLHTIFIGDISHLENYRSGPDWVTKIEAGDGLFAWEMARVNKSFGAGTTIDEVFDALVKALKEKGLSLAADFQAQVLLAVKMRSDEDSPGQYYPRAYLGGLAVHGLVKDWLDSLAKRLGLVWEIRDHTVHVYQRGLFTAETVVSLNSNSGLIGSPSFSDDGGTRFSCLLNPSINPGRQLFVASDTVTGIQVVQRVTHSGDTHGGEWTTTVESTPVEMSLPG